MSEAFKAKMAKDLKEAGDPDDPKGMLAVRLHDSACRCRLVGVDALNCSVACHRSRVLRVLVLPGRRGV